MRSYSITRMRKESRGVLRLPGLCCAALMLSSALYGVIFKVMQVPRDTFFRAAGLQAVLAMCCGGIYLILSDERRLLRKTVFGRALSALGDAERLMKQIDFEALSGCEEMGTFALMENWLILYQFQPARLDPRRVCSLPVPRNAISSVRLLPQRNPADPEENWVQITELSGRVHGLRVIGQRNLDSLFSWAGRQDIPQGKKTEWPL